MKFPSRFVLALLIVTLCWAVNASAVWQVDYESKTVNANQTGIQVDLKAYWDLKMESFHVPTIVRTVSGGAFWTGSLPYDTNYHQQVNGVVWNWSNPGWAMTAEQVAPGLGCTPAGDVGYDGVSPDHFVVSAAGIGGPFGSTPAEPSGRVVLTLTIDANCNAGDFEFDTACFTVTLDRIYMMDSETFQEHGPGGVPDCPNFPPPSDQCDFQAFNKGVITITDTEPSEGDDLNDIDSVIIDLPGAWRYGNDSLLVPIVVSNSDPISALTIPLYYESENDYWRTDVDSSRFHSERWTGDGAPEIIGFSDHFEDGDTTRFLIYARTCSGGFAAKANASAAGGDWDTIAVIHFFKNPDFTGDLPTGNFEMGFTTVGADSALTFFDATGAVYWTPAGAMGNEDDGYDDPPGSIPTDVEDITTDESGIPQEYALYQNYPNPFNAVTQIEFAVWQDSHVGLEIFNILGQKVATLVDGYLTAGLKRTSWDGRDAGGRTVPSGMYFYRLAAGDFVEMKKMVLMK